MMKKLILILCVFILFSNSLYCGASGTGSDRFSCEFISASVKPGNRAELVISCSDMASDIGAFAVEIEFDEQVLTYTKTTAGTKIKSGYYLTSAENAAISSVYTNKTPNRAVNLNGELFRYTFEAGESAGTTAVQVKLYQVVDNAGNSLQASSTYQLTLDISESTETGQYPRLSSLVPETGVLQPAFNPELFFYNMDVPYEVKTLTFEMIAADGAACKVNRKNLGSGGSEVDFVFTVTSSDGKTSVKYQVTVLRNEKITAPAATATPRSAATPRATATPKPAATVKATATPKPAATAKATATPKAAAAATDKNTSSKGKTGDSAERAETGYAASDSMTRYVQDRGATVIFQSDSFFPYVCGMLVALVCVGFGILISNRLGKGKKNKE